MDRPALTHDGHFAVDALVAPGRVSGGHASARPRGDRGEAGDAPANGGGVEGATVLPIPIAVHLDAEPERRRALALPSHAQAPLVAVEGKSLTFHVSSEVRDFPQCIDELVRTVEAALGVRVQQVGESDLVGVGEIARRTGRTRESIRLLVEGRRRAGGFPKPDAVIDRRIRVWHWAAVAIWLETHGVISGDGVQVRDDERGRFLTAYNALLNARGHGGTLSPSSARALRDAVRRLSA